MARARAAPDDLLAAFEAQLRARDTPAGPGWILERSARVQRSIGPDDTEWAGFVGWSDLSGLPPDAVDAEIAAQTASWRERPGSCADGRPRRVEWKAYGHDAPADLGARLERAGWVPDDEETLLVGRVADVLAAVVPVTVDGVGFREVDPAAPDDDLRRIRVCKEEVWDEDFGSLIAELRAELVGGPAGLRIWLAEAAGADGEPVVVSAAWLRLHAGTDFCSLWGGGTRSAWRRRGIYRELVRRRVEQAAGAGHSLVQVDASPDSRPVLERLGLQALTWTRPYVLTLGAPDRHGPGASCPGPRAPESVTVRGRSPPCPPPTPCEPLSSSASTAHRRAWPPSTSRSGSPCCASARCASSMRSTGRR